LRKDKSAWDKNLATKVVIRGRPDFSKELQWTTQSTQLVSGVRVARTLIPANRLSDVPVRAVTLTPEPVTIKAGTLVSELHPVVVVYDDDQEDTALKSPDAQTRLGVYTSGDTFHRHGIGEANTSTIEKTSSGSCRGDLETC
jgi:hypothetical protein